MNHSYAELLPLPKIIEKMYSDSWPPKVKDLQKNVAIVMCDSSLFAHYCFQRANGNTASTSLSPSRIGFKPLWSSFHVL